MLAIAESADQAFAKSALRPRRLPHRALDPGGLGLCISPAGGRVFGREPSLKLLVTAGLVRMRAQPVPERQPLPHLAVYLGDMHVGGTPGSKGRHAFDEEHSVRLRIVRPPDVIKRSQAFDKRRT